MLKGAKEHANEKGVVCYNFYNISGCRDKF